MLFEIGAGHGGDTFGEMIGAMKWLILAGLLTSLLAAPMLGADAAAQGRPLQLSLPIACEPGKNCFVQNYVDHDPGPGVKDYACSSRTYNGHDGIDFRIPDIKAMRDGVPVLAAAAVKEAISITELAAAMGLERSTLTRNLAPLETEGLIAVGNEGRHRSRMVRITPEGRRRMRAALPLWRRAQEALRAKLGEGRWASIDHLAGKLTAPP